MEIAKKLLNSHDIDKSPTRSELITEHLPYVKRIVQRIAVHLPPEVEIN